MKIPVTVLNDKRTVELEQGEDLVALAKSRGENILLATVNGEICELTTKIMYPSKVEFMDITTSYGLRCYQKSAVLIMLMAANRVLGNKAMIWTEHTVNRNLFCQNKGEQLTQEQLDEIKTEMKRIVRENLKIEKMTVPIERARMIFKEYGLEHRIKALQYIKTQSASIYKAGNFYEYLYGPLVPETGFIQVFDLVRYNGGFILRIEDPHAPGQLCPMKDYKKICAIFDECNRWSNILQADTVGALNEIICSGKISDLILVCEALHEKKLVEIADAITTQNKQVVLVAGPSSSGKTTFAKRLGVQLRVNGKKPQLISLDDYYFDKDKIEPDENGEKNFENLEALDIHLFNENLNDLLQGKTVQLPEFNFITGKRQPGRTISLEKNDVLIIEGIHGLNPQLTNELPEDVVYRIYISALTQLNLDEHNRIPTTDTRILRRMVRDFRTRGFDAGETIEIWPMVLDGEEKNIYPYQENADVIFNSALIYELCVIKTLVEPVLFRVQRDSREYTEANRLLKFLNSFLPLNSELVPPNSLLREFIGGSCFK
ncbi:MAG: nucleoside kinase [Firmicutes bacterium]|nr:nucleoside kinase [Bacillota bacterium]